jgi:uncharacterized membrane protein YgdD (TMEM256/DUF423 family)
MSEEHQLSKVNVTWPIRVAALMALIGVVLGALGAHGLQDTLEANGAVESWKT